MSGFIRKNRDKKSEKKPMKSIVTWQAYYPDICMIQTAEGYTRMYRMDDVHGEDRDSYEREVRRYVKFRKDLKIQISHIGEKDYILYTVQTATPEEAHAKLLAADITFDPVPLKEWFSAITEMTRSGPFTDTDRIGAVNKKGKLKGKLLPHLQPFYPPPRYDPKGKVLKNRDGRVFEADDRFLRTVVLTG